MAFSLKDCLDALTAPLHPPRRLVVVGGGARSRYWLAVLATVLGLPIAVPADATVGAAFGAAPLGLAAAEGADPFELCQPPTMRETIDPIPVHAEAYAAAHAAYRALYPVLKQATAS